VVWVHISSLTPKLVLKDGEVSDLCVMLSGIDFSSFYDFDIWLLIQCDGLGPYIKYYTATFIEGHVPRQDVEVSGHVFVR
jgi:hypothetical protein